MISAGIVEVPTDADFVIEGYVDPSSLRYDATSPLGKPKHLRRPVRRPHRLLHVARAVSRLPSRVCGTITHRKDAVYPATIVGIPPMEDFYIGGVPRLRDETLPAHPAAAG